MKRFIIVWFDNTSKEFNNSTYDVVTKSEAVKIFRKSYTEDAVLVNIIEL